MELVVPFGLPFNALLLFFFRRLFFPEPGTSSLPFAARNSGVLRSTFGLRDIGLPFSKSGFEGFKRSKYCTNDRTPYTSKPPIVIRSNIWTTHHICCFPNPQLTNSNCQSQVSSSNQRLKSPAFPAKSPIILRTVISLIPGTRASFNSPEAPRFPSSFRRSRLIDEVVGITSFVIMPGENKTMSAKALP